LTRRLLRALLAHAVLRVADGSRAVTTTVDVIAAAAARGRLCGVKTTRGVLGDVFDAIDEDGETTDVEVVDSARTENLWRLLPLVDETVARAAAVATGCVTTNSAETMTNTHKQDPEFDEEDWHMLDGTWRVLEELANFGETTRREDGTALVGEEHSAHSTDASPKRATARVAALQRTAFHLAIVYVHAAPIKLVKPQRCLWKLCCQRCYPYRLRVSFSPRKSQAQVPRACTFSSRRWFARKRFSDARTRHAPPSRRV